MGTYDYRRNLSAREELTAVGAALGVAAGVATVVWYFGRMFLQRAPLVAPEDAPAAGLARPRAAAPPRPR